LPRLEGVLTELLGARVQTLVRRVERPASMRPIEGAISILLSRADSDGAPFALRIDAERALAAVCVARVVRQTPPTIADASGTTPWLAGAFAAIVVAAARRSLGGAVLRVERAEPAGLPELDPWWAESNAVGVSMTVLVGDDAYLARIGVARDRIALAPGPLWGAAALRSLGATPLSLPLVACSWATTVEEIGALREGDVVVPATWPIARAPGTPTRERQLAGTLALAAPGSSDGVRVELGEGGGVVLGGDLVSLDGADGASKEIMGESDESAWVRAVGEVPVVVRVEVGEATLAAREWAALGRGDVIGLSRRIGDRVVLRIGGVAVARGELVDIEGELGVRIAERIRETDGGATE
jgi:flagellar motor switch/type III secretory pathway protein FliN